jgi:hypothetical protein
MVPLIAFLCVLENVRQRKKISIEKHKIFLFQVFDFGFFTKIFHPTTVSESESESVSESELFVRIRIRIQPKNSDYFGFGSTTLLSGTVFSGTFHVLRNFRV